MGRRVQWLVGGVLVLLGVGFVLTWVVRGRAMQDRVYCANHLRLLGQAAYLDPAAGAEPKPRREVPAGTVFLPNVPPERRLSWLVPALPVYPTAGVGLSAFDLGQPADADKNKAAGAVVVRTLFCPALVPAEPTAVTHYVGLAGLGADAGTLPPADPRAGAFRYDSPTPFAAVTDGLSNTLLFSEALSGGPWAVGGPGTVRGADDRPLIGGQFVGGHAGGVNVGVMDGSVRFITPAVSPEYLRRLLTINGGGAEVD